MAKKTKKVQNLIDMIPADQLREVRAKCRPGSYNCVQIELETKTIEIVHSLYCTNWRDPRYAFLSPDDLW